MLGERASALVRSPAGSSSTGSTWAPATAGPPAAVVERDLALITPVLEERVVLVLDPASQHAAHLGAVGVAPNADRPLVTANGAQVLLGFVEQVSVAFQVDHDVAQKVV